MKPVRIQRKRTKGWRMPEGAVSVTRPGPWGNPFRVYRVADAPKQWWVDQGSGYSSVWTFATRREALFAAVRLFEHWITHPVQQKRLAEAQIALRGKDLACWCPLDAPCHADVLLELANR